MNRLERRRNQFIDVPFHEACGRLLRVVMAALSHTVTDQQHSLALRSVYIQHKHPSTGNYQRGKPRPGKKVTVHASSQGGMILSSIYPSIHLSIQTFIKPSPPSPSGLKRRWRWLG